MTTKPTQPQGTPLPEPVAHVTDRDACMVWWNDKFIHISQAPKRGSALYTANQMREYAAEAVRRAVDTAACAGDDYNGYCEWIVKRSLRDTAQSSEAFKAGIDFARALLSRQSDTPQQPQDDRYFSFEFEVWQGDDMQASASGTREMALKEAMNYAAQYAQDGTVRVFEVVRKLVHEIRSDTKSEQALQSLVDQAQELDMGYGDNHDNGAQNEQNSTETRASVDNMVVPKDDGWIEWNGGECPVNGHISVEVELRNGLKYNVRAASFVWRHDGEDDDIIAYRISKGEK